MQQPVEEKGADNARKVHVVCPLIDTHESGHGHSHKLTQLYLWLPSQTPVFSQLPHKICIFTFPLVASSSYKWTPFLRSKGVHSQELQL